MDGVSLQFQGTGDERLCVALLSAVSVALAAFGVWRLILRQRRYGLMCLAGAAVGPIVAASTFLANPSSAAAWLWPTVIGLQVVLAVGMFYSATYSYLGGRRIAVLMLLRCLAIAALMLILFKPVLNVSAGAGEARPFLPIVVDRSGSMATEDEAHPQNRYVRAIQALRRHADRIESVFQPVWYHFGGSVASAESLGELGELKPTGPGTSVTNIARAIRDAPADYATGDIPAVFILTDGVHNASESVPDAARRSRVPIYAVGIGSTGRNLAARPNAQLLSVEGPTEAVVNNVTKISARVKLTGLAGAEVELHLLEEGGEPVATVHLRAGGNIETKTCELSWTPREPTSGDGDAASTAIRKLRIVVQPVPGEHVVEDNRGELHVLITQPRIRVLYVEGTMRSEYRFLKRSLDPDPNVQFMSLVRVEKNRFSAYGSIGGRKLLRLPTTDEDFRMFDVLILGDLDRSFLTLDQMAGIRRFVNDGGGLVMIGGHNSFGPGGYGGTDIEKLLPVVVGGRTQPQEMTQFLPKFTAAGETHPILDGLADYFPGPDGRKPKAGLPVLPDLRGCVTVVRAKPGAAVLAVHPARRNEVGPLIVLAAQRFGAGRSCAFTADTTWRWTSTSPYRRFWGQMIRWLAGVETKTRKAGSSVLLRTDRPSVKVGGAVRILAMVRDRTGRPCDLARVTCTAEPKDGKPRSLELQPTTGGGAGMFESEFRPAVEGRYRLKVRAADAEGRLLGTDELPLYVAPHSAETDNLARDETLLRTIADDSGGRYADLSDLHDMLDEVISRHRALAPKARAKSYRLFHFTGLFLLFVAILSGEWLLRRSWHLH